MGGLGWGLGLRGFGVRFWGGVGRIEWFLGGSWRGLGVGVRGGFGKLFWVLLGVERGEEYLGGGRGFGEGDWG